MDLAILIVSCLIGIVVLIAFIARIVLLVRYFKINRKQTSNGLTGRTSAELLLSGLGMSDVGVVKCNWFLAVIFGNHYSKRSNQIKLRKNILDKASLTAVGVATQKVGLAILDRNGDKDFKRRNFLQGFVWFAPFAFVPLVIIGIILDIVVAKTVGVFTLVALALGIVYYLIAFILMFSIMKVEEKANRLALEALEKANMLSAEELNDVRTLYNTYKINYVIDFILSLLYLIKYILQFLKVFIKKN